jgi:hypothetical protein
MSNTTNDTNNSPQDPEDTLPETVRQLLQRERTTEAQALLSTCVLASYLFWQEDGLPFEYPVIPQAQYAVHLDPSTLLAAADDKQQQQK